jgi:cytoskeletal protein CcmA (bactofilin family)
MLKTNANDMIKSDETTIISNGVKIEGKITCTGSIRIDSEVLGDILSQSFVTVGEKGQVNGQVNAGVITIGGKVSGTLKAKDKIVLESRGDVNGDIFTKILVVEEGAKFDGKSKMGGTIDFMDNKETIKPITNSNQ